MFVRGWNRNLSIIHQFDKDITVNASGVYPNNVPLGEVKADSLPSQETSKLALFSIIKMLQAKHSERDLIATANPFPVDGFLDLYHGKRDTFGFLKKNLNKMFKLPRVLAG